MRSIFALIAGLWLAVQSFAQPNQPRRVEIETRTNADQMHVVPVESEGVILFTEAQPGKYTFTRYNTDLKEDWTVDCVVNSTLSLNKYVYRDKALYLLFNRFKSPNYQVIKLNVRAGFAEKYEFYSLDRLDIVDFDALGTNAFIAGKTRNEPVLLHVNLPAKKARLLPSAFKSRTDIQSLTMDTLTRTLHATFVEGKSRNKKNVIVKSFTPAGEPVRNLALSAEGQKDYDLLNGKLSALDDSVELVIGTYGTQGPVYARATTYNYFGYGWGSTYQGTADYSQGIYISKFQGGQQNFLKYYSFTDFKNFFQFMGDKQRERMESRINRRKSQGRDLRLQYRLLVHDIIERNGQYIMVAEAYYPEYRSNYNSMYPGPWGYGYGYGGFGGMPYNRNTPIFDGWVYTHAVIAGFDHQGKLLWDNSFEISDVKTFSLREKVKVSFDNENLMLAYNHKGELKTKVIRGNEVLEAKENVPIGTDYQGDRVRKSYTDEIEYWYGNNFLAWGYQKIRNDSNEQVRGRRSVFYFTKVGF
jgi:hypothetical protein